MQIDENEDEKNGAKKKINLIFYIKITIQNKI